jgi:LDH2 family malate/lactate/ureidoglycolate dehydrogenase
VLAAVKASGAEGKIRLPGESSARIAAERASAGTLPLPAKIWETICHTAEHGLPK